MPNWRQELGLCTARDESKSCCWCVLKDKLGILAEFGGVLCADHVKFHSCHPYIERLPTLDIIVGSTALMGP